MARTSVVHFRIHYRNSQAWCGLVLQDAPTSKIQVVTLPDRHEDLTKIRWTADKHIDYTPRTREEKAEARALWNATVSQVTCRRCTQDGRRFQVR